MQRSRVPGRWRAAATAALLALACAAVRGADAAAQALDLPVKEYVLPNGLKLLVLPRTHVPQVVCRITYRVGSVNERPGITGISHILEHMMFKGTEKIGVTDAGKDRDLMTRIEALMARIRPLQAALAPEDLAACRAYEKDKRGAPPAAWPRYEELNSAMAEFAQLRQAQDANLIPEELWEVYRKAGGTDLNAATGNDATNYYVKLPAGMEELFFWLESDRMASAVFRQFYPEIGVIREERRQRVEDAPTGRFNEQLNALFFEASPYRWPVIGYDEDIARVTPADLAAYFDIYYRPNNAHVTIVGDVDPDACARLAEKYFGRIGRGKDVPAPPLASPRQVGVSRLEAEARAPDRVVVYYHTPPEGHPDSLALDCAAETLNGPTGRLHRALVLRDKLAVRVMAFNMTRKYGGLFGVIALAAPGADLGKLEAAVLAEAASLGERPPDDAELARAKIGFEAQFVKQLETLMGTASLLADGEAATSWRDVTTYLTRLSGITAQHVADNAKKYLGPVRTVGVLRRAADAARPATPQN
jgi:predicted Zn-dependent peptidase